MPDTQRASSSAESASKMRRIARSIYDHALAECSIARAFARHVSYSDSVLSLRDDSYDLSALPYLTVVSIGKAGHTMSKALSQIVTVPVRGIVSCPMQPSAPVSHLQYFVGGHPLPNEDSLRAGSQILELLSNSNENDLVLFLISGGASAIAESPFLQHLTLSDIIATYRVLVHSGAPIAEINAIRKHLSAIKGGRMAQAACPAQQHSLLVSDVPDNSLDALASGPTMPDSTTINDCYAIAERYTMLERFPASVRQAFAQGRLAETPKPHDPVFANSRFTTLLSNTTAVAAAAERAIELGFEVEIDNRCDDWDYAIAADYLLHRLRTLHRQSTRTCLISGGEVTVKVGTTSGTGGRNQQFALYCATRIVEESITVLSAGTDGIDGNSGAAGALVDGASVSRINQSGENAQRVLTEFNTNPVLERIGDAIITGPTGNNVRDLRILLAY